jgi:microcystin-dependent protein
MDYFLGEIRLFPFGVVPKDWHLCDGSVLPITQNQALFSLIGNYFGGTPGTNFALPDLGGRAIVGAANNIAGTYGGAETVTLTINQTPVHNHTFGVTKVNGASFEPNDVLAVPHDSTNNVNPINIYSNSSSNLINLTNTIQNTGGGQSHNNMQPFLAMSYCICTSGIYPSRP